MGIWNYDAFGSDDAYDLLGAWDDMLAARKKDGRGLRAALLICGLPCVGYTARGTISVRNPSISLPAAQAALHWLAEKADAAIREVRPGGEPHPELTAVAALATLAVLLLVAGPKLPRDTPRLEQWALWLETAPVAWTPDPARLATRRQVARALREGTPLTHTGVCQGPEIVIATP